ncbi:hypothetical protein ACHAW5_007674 [Stephanodiscus triporus]|uniref:Uncharacterized protein n=1 Tax=Stephanodiscus triporus TaxID=2934178 RepID=A0ABD3QX85_9STRA
MSFEELEEEMRGGSLKGHEKYANDNDDDDDLMDMLLMTHYEATHDVVGRVRIHRFVNPECYTDGPEGEEYLMAEATVLDVVENERTKTRKALEDRKRRSKEAALGGSASSSSSKATTTKTTTTALKFEGKQQRGAVGDVAKAVARIKEELRSSVGEAFEKNRQQQQPDSDGVDEKSRPSPDGATKSFHEKLNNAASSAASDKRKGRIPPGGSGARVSLTEEERSLRESFARLVALQHELKEECRFMRVPTQTFGVGQVGVWLSAAAWSQFVEKRLEATYFGMQSDLQARLVEYLADGGGESGRGIGGYVNAKHAEDDGAIEGSGYVEVGETIDYEDLSPELQREFQLFQARATEELGPLALERAIQMQCIIQAESYSERLDLLRECVDNERRRLEAKKMLKSLDGDVDRKGGVSLYSGSRNSRERARTVFERLMSTDVASKEQSKDLDKKAFQ